MLGNVSAGSVVARWWWTEAEKLSALRTATAMALAVNREHPGRMEALWSAAPDKQAVVWGLARLPGLLVENLHEDLTSADVGQVLQSVALQLAMIDERGP
jgi:hypothetical protein